MYCDRVVEGDNANSLARTLFIIVLENLADWTLHALQSCDPISLLHFRSHTHRPTEEDVFCQDTMKQDVALYFLSSSFLPCYFVLSVSYLINVQLGCCLPNIDHEYRHATVKLRFVCVNLTWGHPTGVGSKLFLGSFSYINRNHIAVSAKLAIPQLVIIIIGINRSLAEVVEGPTTLSKEC